MKKNSKTKLKTRKNKFIIEGKGIGRTFVNGKIITEVLRGIDISVKEGEFLAIMGRSGAGKSTLLYQLSLLDIPTTGSIKIDGKDMLKVSQKNKTSFRLRNLGFVFQDYALIPELTATENVILPLIMRGINSNYAKTKAHEVLKEMGLENHFNNLPSQLSGGEQQRVSIARAIVHKPKIIFADEPTANLDSASAQNVISILDKINKKNRQTIIMVTHEKEYAKSSDRIVFLDDGKVVQEKN